MKSNFIKLVIIGLFLISISGCANTRALEVNDVSNDVGYIAQNQSILANNIQVEAEKFTGTSKVMIKNDTMPTFDNNDAKEAIAKVLKRANLYNSNGEYRLTATLDRDYTGAFTTSRNLVINYTLTDIRNNRVVFNEKVNTDGSTTVNNIFFGNTYETAYRSGLDAFNKNFYEMTILIGNHDK